MAKRKSRKQKPLRATANMRNHTGSDQQMMARSESRTRLFSPLSTQSKTMEAVKRCRGERYLKRDVIHLHAYQIIYMAQPWAPPPPPPPGMVMVPCPAPCGSGWGGSRPEDGTIYTYILHTYAWVM